MQMDMRLVPYYFIWCKLKDWFAGDDGTEDPYVHVDFFDDICWTSKLNVFTCEEMKLIFF
jgi:hypothetical protein